jgi:hypothetical protein
MEKQHLHLLINEEIYRIAGDEAISATKNETLVEEVNEAPEESIQVSEPEPKPIAKQEESLVEEQPTPKPEPTQQEEPTIDKPAVSKPTQESPEIPVKKKDEPKVIPLAIFHSSTNQEEMELLQKIIDACKVPIEDYTIFENGFDQSVKFKKALVFVPEAKAFYTPIPYKNSHFLCSKPLADLASNQEEKGKLWVSLQKFVLN